MKIYRSIAAAAALALACTSFTVPAFAADETETLPAEDETVAAAKNADTADDTEALPSKDETVYVVENTDGSAEKVIVSDTFSNVSAEDAEKYTAELTDAQKITENNWQGTSDKELPVQISITYTLDGEEIAPEDLAGKSGHVVIRFDYTNTEMEDGLYVPFAALTGTYLDNDNFTNVEVTNGTLINDGDRTIVAGLAFPGINENISSSIDTMKSDLAEKLPDNADDINAIDIDFPEYVEISADTTNFQLVTALTIVTGLSSLTDETGSITGIDLSGFDDTLAQVKDDMTQLSDGSSELATGLETLLTSCNDLSDGISQLATGLSTLTGNNETLVTGAETVFTTLLSTAESQITAAGLELPESLTIENYNTVLNTVLDTLNDPTAYAEEQARAQVEAAVNANESQVRDAVTEAVREQVEEKVTEAVRTEVEAQVTEAVKAEVWNQILATQGLDSDSYDAAVAGGLITEDQQAQLSAALDQQMASDEVTATISATTDQQMTSDEVTATISTNTDQQMTSDEVAATIDSNVEEQIASLIEENLNSDDVQAQITAGAATISAGVESIKTLQTQLDSYNEFYTGLKTYTEGVASASEGAETINDSMPDLITGVTDLQTGAGTLSDALAELKDLADSADTDLSGIRDVIERSIDLGKAYTSFTDNQDNISSKVKFIYRTDSIE